ncbi:MAG: tRNA(Ile)-lysidine synthase [Bacteroidota bacterium]|nr:tRNA(Ile)-lysidine synthase [Bacteroidota bacterium]
MNKNKTLLQKFIEFNAIKRMAGIKKRCLLTVSGGMDSVVMCDLFNKAGFPFAIAHCNFTLRGKESDGDELFVKSLGEKYGVDVFTKAFDTKKYATEKNVSTQLAARELRYQWFEELRVEKKLNLIATAHHLNDNIETIVFNLVKGTGIRGLRGIPVRQGNIVRPLLFATRDEIQNHQKENQLQFREDSSNAEEKYTRNKIRHSVIPLLKEINPSLEATLGEKIDLFSQLEAMYERQMSNAAKQLFLQRKNDIYIPILKLKKTKNANSVLFEYLKHYGFGKEHIEDMLANLNNTPGKQFISDKARIIKDRQFFILTQLPEKDFTTKLIEEKDSEVKLGNVKLKLSVSAADKIKITADKTLAFIDKSKLQFPLIVRRWKQGDYFYPFGMKLKKKKLKKFLIDEKVSLNEKENIWVLESDKKIVWVVGYRIDERFKITPKTTQVLKIQMKAKVAKTA